MDCIEKTGQELNTNNHDIVKYICDIEEERNTLELIIQKQYQERQKVEAEIEKLTYKLCLINKSLSMRIKAKNNYDKTLEDITAHYEKLVDSSNKLKQIVEKSQQELDDLMNKKTGTTSGPEDEAVQMLYVKPAGSPKKLSPDDCPCSYSPEIPTKDQKKSSLSSEQTETSSGSSPNRAKLLSITPGCGVKENSVENLVAKWSIQIEEFQQDSPVEGGTSTNGSPEGASQKRRSKNGNSDLHLSTNGATAPGDSTTPAPGNIEEGGPAFEHQIKEARSPHSSIIKGKTDDKSVNIVLAQLKASMVSNTSGAYAKDRNSKILSNKDPNNHVEPEPRPSLEQSNKMMKKSIHDILSPEYPQR